MPLYNPPVGGSGGGASPTAVEITPSYSVVFAPDSGLYNYTSGGYAMPTLNNGVMATYDGSVFAGPNVRLESYTLSTIPVSSVVGLSCYLAPFGFVDNSVSFQAYIGYGPVGSGSAEQDIDLNQPNIGFYFDVNKDSVLRVMAVTGDGTSHTKTEIYAINAAATDGYIDGSMQLSVLIGSGSARFFHYNEQVAVHTTNLPSDTTTPYRGWTFMSQKKEAMANNRNVGFNLYNSSYSLK